MKRPVSIVTITALLFSSIVSYSQYANLEFVENKGQWDVSVKFKGVMNNGAFFLKKKKVLEFYKSNPEDLQKMAFYHGVSYEFTKKMEAEVNYSF